jgi:hypothetical protein
MFQDGERGHHVRHAIDQGNGTTVGGHGRNLAPHLAAHDFAAKIFQESFADIHSGHPVKIFREKQGLGPVSTAEINQMAAFGREKPPDQTSPALQDELSPGGRSTSRQVVGSIWKRVGAVRVHAAITFCYPVVMNDPKKPESDSESTESLIRRDRKFTLAEAVGREAAGAMSGASPVARAEQVLLEIEQILESRLVDSPGSLARTILARLKIEPPLLARHFDRPVGALEEFLGATLGSGSLLTSLVRDTDARWGRDYGERPHFETEGKPPHPDDPYTLQGVRDLLEDLLESLGED